VSETKYQGERLIRGYVPESLKARFKATCALKQKNMSQVLTELIEKWLEENEETSSSKGKRK